MKSNRGVQCSTPIRIALRRSGGAEDGDAGAQEVERAEAGDELPTDPEDPEGFGRPAPGSIEEDLLVGGGGRLAPIPRARGLVRPPLRSIFLRHGRPFL